jgi:hypothetical protein
VTRPLVAAAAACCLLGTGCSGSAPQAVSADAAGTLRADTLALTRLAAADQWPAARRALADLRRDLAAAFAAGDVSVERAQAIRADAATIAADLATHSASPTPSPAASTPTSHTPPPPKPPKPNRPPKHGHGHGEGD